jgi:PGF-CTERM protein
VSFTGDGDELAGYAYDLGFDPAVIQPDSDGFIVDTNAPVDQSSAGDDGVFVAGSEGENIGDSFSWTLAFDIVGDPGDQTIINFGGTTQATDENSSVFDLTLESGLVTVEDTEQPAVFDVAITDVPAEVTEGDDITVGYQVENTGDLQGTQDIGFTVDGDQQGTQQVTLTGGETFSNSFTYTTETGDETGDAPTVTVEVASADDSASETVTVQQPGGSAVFDIAITDVPAEVTEGDDITVGYQVENTGEAEGSKGISFTVDGDQQGTQQVTLTDGETFSDSFTYTTVSGDTPTVTVEVTSVDDSASETVTVRETQPRELSEEEIDERFDTPEDQRPARAEENTLVGTADGEGSETTFSENIIVESVRINANVDQTVAVAEYDDEVTGIPSPGSVVATADIVVSDSTADTTGTIVERIPVDRLEEVGAEPEDLQVFRVIDGNAEPVGTEVIERTDQVVRLEIETPGFSFFVTSAVSEPEAAFDVTPEQPVAGDELTLSGESSTDEYGEIESYEWQVTGDTIGQRTLTGVEVATVLEQPGEYDVELVIENDAGQTSNETATVTVEQSEPELTGLSVGLGSETLTEGSTTGVTVTAEFDDGSTQDVTADAAIESTNTTVATVSGSTITGDTAGTAEITAEFEGQTASQQLTIEQTEPTLTGVSLELTATTIEVGETTDVTVTAEFDDGTTEDVTGQASIESGDASIASVDETTVTGEDAGDVEITVTFNGETATESLSVEAGGDDGSDNNNSTDGSGPGFGIMAAVLAIIILGYAVRRRN